MDLDDVIPGPHYRICHSRVARAPLPAVGMLCTGLPCPLCPWGMRSRACASCLPGFPARSPGRWPAVTFST